MMSQQPLLVHIVFHPESAETRELALAIHHALNDDPIVPGLRIPTQFCPTDGKSPIPPYTFKDAERHFVVVLADAWVVDTDSEITPRWSTFIGDLWEQCQHHSRDSEASEKMRFFPIQLHEAAWGFDERLTQTNFLRAHLESTKEQRDALVIRRIIIELSRFLANESVGDTDESQAPLTLFLSHTKLDLQKEPMVFNTFNDYFKASQPVKAWVDSGQIETGSAFVTHIEKGLEDSSLLCLLTENYATREWCRKEVIIAKQYQRPIVVVVACSGQEIRSFPYLGNVPVYYWPHINADIDADERYDIQQNAAITAIDLLLKETLRHQYVTAVLQRDKQEAETVLARPPELLSLLALNDTNAVLYPDPPLGSEELDLMSNISISTTTPLSRIASDRPLKGTKVALSMSESTDIERYGYDKPHFLSAMIELTRYLLLKGTTLVYGGHLGEESYTKVLFEMVQAYHSLEGVDKVERIVNTVGWPLPWNQDIVASFNKVAKLQRIARPPELDIYPGKDIADHVEAEPFPPNKSLESRYCWSRGMTQMRAAQTAEDSGIAARIILGGKIGPPQSGPGSEENWYAGRIPGVLEEAALATQTGQPLFLIGAYGGAAALIIDLLEGRDREEATWEYQCRAPHSEALRETYQQQNQEWLGYREITDILRNKGVEGINPLLTVEQNHELFRTTDISKIIEIVLTGLQNLDGTSSS